jgi:hypothetical protein
MTLSPTPALFAAASARIDLDKALDALERAYRQQLSPSRIGNAAHDVVMASLKMSATATEIVEVCSQISCEAFDREYAAAFGAGR